MLPTSLHPANQRPVLLISRPTRGVRGSQQLLRPRPCRVAYLCRPHEQSSDRESQGAGHRGEVRSRSCEERRHIVAPMRRTRPGAPVLWLVRVASSLFLAAHPLARPLGPSASGLFIPVAAHTSPSLIAHSAVRRPMHNSVRRTCCAGRGSGGSRWEGSVPPPLQRSRPGADRSRW